MIRVTTSDTVIALPGRNINTVRLDPLFSEVAALILRHGVLKDFGSDSREAHSAENDEAYCDLWLHVLAGSRHPRCRCNRLGFSKIDPTGHIKRR
jgi:hypothetical protein